MLSTCLQTADPDPFLECTLADNEVSELSARFDQPCLQASYSNEPALDELLQAAGTERILPRI
jgi:hypothetical protein